ncbi:MAG: hypothetical protein ACE5EX_05875 [Phycisphaerae bacterium]
MLSQFRRFDVQARYACWLALLSVLPAAAAVALAVRNYHPEMGQIVYGGKGLFLPAFLACLGLSVVPGVCGLLLGWSSAQQRRNDTPARSWIGFFVGSGVVTLDVVLLLAFAMLRLQQPM